MISDDNGDECDLTCYARGRYQRDIVTGNARISGSDLAARGFRHHTSYRASRHNLISRLRAAGHVVTVERRLSSASGRGIDVLVVDGRAVSRSY